MPRRSSGCRNCVRRRVRCDEFRPVCENCYKLSLRCDGPQQGVIFIYESQMTDQTISRNRSRGYSRKEATDPSPETTKSSGRSMTAYTMPLQAQLSGVKWGTDVWIGFLCKHWDHGDKTWVDQCVNQSGSYPTANLAIDALATAFYGKRHHENSIIAQAATKYSKALIALRQTLEPQTGSCSFDILAATTALYRYEVVLCTSNEGWIKHAGGISKLIEVNGPQIFEKYPNKAILDANRFRVVCQAYWYRKRTFLENPRWNEPRIPQVGPDYHFRQLQDLYARLARLSEDINDIITGCHSGEDLILYASEESSRLLEDLISWSDVWKGDYSFEPCERFDTHEKHLYHDKSGPVFESYLAHANLRAAVGLNMCNAFRLTTLEWKHKLENPSWWAGDAHERAHEIPDGPKLAIDMCRSLHLHFGGDGNSDLHEIFAFMYTIRSAYKMFPRRSREAQWITKDLAAIAHRSGFEVAESLFDMYEPKWQATRAQGLVHAHLEAPSQREV